MIANRTVRGLLTGFLSAAAAVAHAGDIGTTFTLQAQLKQAGQPVNQPADVRATLFDAAVGGNPVGATIQLDNVPVADGIVLADLDFGAMAFFGESRFIELEIRVPHDPGNTAPFTALNGRLPLRPTPEAIHAQVASSLRAPVVISGDDANGAIVTVENVAPGGAALDVLGDLRVGPQQEFQVDADTGSVLTQGSLTANTLAVAADAFVGGLVDAGDVDVAGNVDVGNDIDVGDDANISDDLNVGHDATVTNDLNIGSNAVVGNDLDVFSDTNLNGFLNIGTPTLDRFIVDPTTGFMQTQGDISVLGAYVDSQGSRGQQDQFLSSTGVGTMWRDLIVGPLDLKNNALINIGTGGSSFDATGSLKINGFLEVGNAGNTFFLVEGGSGNTSIAGNLFVGPISSERFFVEGATGTTKIGPAGAEVFSVDGDDGDIHTTRRYFDSSGQPGTADQVLSATGSGTLWIDAPTPIINTALNMNSHAITNIGSGGSSFSGSGDLNLNNNLITNIGPPGSGFAPNGLLIMKADIQVGRTAPLAVINAENGGAGFKGALTVGNVGGIPPFIVNDQGDLATDGNAHVKGQYRDSTDPLGLPGEPGQFLSSTGVGTRWRDLIVAPLDMKSFAITNIGSGGASFSGAGGLNLKGDLDLGMNGITGIGTANSFFFPDGSLTVRPVLTVQDAQGQTTLSSSGSLTSSMVDFVVGPAQFSVDADTGDTLISGSLFVANEFRDSGNFPGAANQILASTGAGTQWVNPPGSGGSGNFSEIAVTGNTGLGDDENDTTTVTGDATFSRDLTIGRNADIQRDLVVAGDSHLNGSVFDSAGLPGDADQFLSSTGTGTLWRDLIVGPLDMKNNAITNIGGGGSSFGGDGSLNVIGNLNVGSGNFTVNGTTGDASSQRDMAAGRDLLVSGDSHINGSYFDSPGLPGDPGQILSSTGSGTLWIDPPSGGGGTNCVCVDFEVPGAMTVDSSSASFTVPLNAQGPFNFITNVVTDLIQVSPPTNPFSPVVQVTATSDFAPMARFHNFLGTAPAVQIQGTTEMNGNATINGDLFVSGAIINPSDARLKHNVAPIDDALAIVARLRGVRFDWRRYEFPDRRFPETRQVGFIAQELKDALPEVVSEDKDGFQAVDYAKVTAVLAEAVKELDAKLAKRESQFQELSARLERIESVLGAGAPAAVAAVPADRTGK